MKKMVLAALLGGLVVFLWGALAHTVLPLGQAGLSTLPNEEKTLEALSQSVPESGLYFFPGLDMSREHSPEEEEAWQARYRSGPIGLLMFRVHGEDVLPLKNLLLELLTNILAAALAAVLVLWLAAPYFQRVTVVTLLGLFSWISLSLSYWIWYGFPTAYILSEGVTELVGWFLGGLVIARFVTGREVPAS